MVHGVRLVHDHVSRLVVGYVDHLRVDRFDDDGLSLLRHHLALVGFQVARRVCAVAKVLDRLQQLRLLVKSGFAQLPGPVEIRVHELDHFRVIEQRHNRVVPVLVGLELGVGFVRFQITGGLYDLKRIRGCRQYDTHQVVRVERNGAHELLELSRRQRYPLFGNRRCRPLCLNRLTE